jgi:hypothetical protein
LRSRNAPASRLSTTGIRRRRGGGPMGCAFASHCDPDR